MERLLKMEPKVECTLDSMKLQIHDAASTPGSLLFVDRGSHLSPLPLSKLPSSCGYTIRSTQRDLVLVAPYDGCFVALEEGSYVLPLLWWGLPVRMTCPLMSPLSLNPPVVTCNTEGMLIKTEWTLPVSNIKVKLNGNWQPLSTASNRCGFSTVEHPEGVVISARYTPCMEKKDGLYTLEVAGDGETAISCPSEVPAQPEYTENPAKNPEWQSETPSEGVYPPSFLRDPHQALKPAKVEAPQLPGLPQNSNIPNKEPEGPDHPFYPTFFYPYSANPVNTPAVPAVNPRRASSSVIQTAKDKRWQNFFPFYSQPPAPKTVPTQPPTKPPGTEFEEHMLPSLFQKPVFPPASQPESVEKKPLHQFSFFPQINEAHPAYQKLPEKPEAPQPEAQVQVSHPLFFYPQLKPEIQLDTKPSTVPQPPQPEAPPYQLQQQMYLCPESQMAMDPNAALALGTETLLEEVYKLCQPSEKTTGTNDETDAIEKQSTQPPHRHPQGQMDHLSNQLYYPQQLQPVTFPSTTYMQQQAPETGFHPVFIRRCFKLGAQKLTTKRQVVVDGGLSVELFSLIVWTHALFQD
ncbi:titin-like [Archocentrus centrarchus]|uniref:titin-like n=1 Tax=Archocentrus centrarchus TaxID=63155 RepID=UPI0011EA05D5|nr:titin-like [Archocentrus centrarchus]